MFYGDMVMCYGDVLWWYGDVFCWCVMIVTCYNDVLCFPFPEDPAVAAMYQTIADSLAQGLRQNPRGREEHRQREDSRRELPIKCEYQGEKR